MRPRWLLSLLGGFTLLGAATSPGACGGDTPLGAVQDAGSGAGGGADGGTSFGGNAPSVETCGNGLDDDANGKVDEGCVCQAGATQPCYGGPAARAGVGVCAYGQQACVVHDAETDFATWGPCEGWVPPSLEVCGDLVDDDCDGSTDDCGEGTADAPCNDGKDNDDDGLTDCNDPDCSGKDGCPKTSLEADCGDGKDDDGDGLIDCSDPDCAGSPNCPQKTLEADCGNGKDDDGDGQIDCADLDCADDPTCPPTKNAPCADGKDGDGDGLVDCSDDECSNAPECGIPTKEGPCVGGQDEDQDGKVDCADSDCAASTHCGCTGERCVPGTWRWCDTPVGCKWGKQTCKPDGQWGTCVETAETPPGCSSHYYYNTQCCLNAPDACCQNYPANNSLGECDTQLVKCCEQPNMCQPKETFCADGQDNDKDGLVDCADPHCFESEACPATHEGKCNNGLDGDGDGKIDCADPDCEVSIHCGCVEVCAAGELRWCVGAAGTWGQQTCVNGAWSACVSTLSYPPGCASAYYDQSCCEASPDDCCQSYPGNHSVGECVLVSACQP